jgi:hypothetical protein
MQSLGKKIMQSLGRMFMQKNLSLKNAREGKQTLFLPGYFEGCLGAQLTLFTRGACASGSPLHSVSGTAQRCTPTMYVYTSGCEAEVDTNSNGLTVLR